MRTILLFGTTIVVVAFALSVFFTRPSTRSPAPPARAGASAAPSSHAGEASVNSSAALSGFDGAALPPGVRARDFTLSDQYGRRVSLVRYRGHVVVLTFLYSTCGPTCVLIAQQVRGALDELSHPAAVLFVSADPATDTPARVARFLARVSLSGRVLFLSGPLSEVRRLWRAYGVAPASSGQATFDRSASVLLIDTRGFLRVLFPLEQLTPESLTHDVRRLQSGA